jgi:hypothetical protein
MTWSKRQREGGDDDQDFSHLWYTDKADKAAAFYASKVEPDKHIGRLNARVRFDHRDRKPPNRGLRGVPCYGFQL